jgi:ribosomal-protein-alanine N-acetyltransferase
MLIRPLSEDDATQIKKLEAELGLAAWSERDYRSEAAREDTLSFVAESAGLIVGFIVSRVGFEVEILNLGVVPRNQKMGIGKALVSEVIRGLRSRGTKRLSLEVRASNTGAKTFYSSLGFTVDGSRPNFYSSPTEDAVLMSLEIEPQSRFD